MIFAKSINMQEIVLDFLRCPVCRGDIQLQTISVAEKNFKSGRRNVVKSGILLCSCGFLFPIIESAPRMLIESFIEHEDFLSQHLAGFSGIKQNLLNKYGYLIQSAEKRNKRTKSSFSFEWELLRDSETNIWRLDKMQYREQLFAELKLSERQLHNKLVIDVGSGHGRSTTVLSETSKTAFGIDLGLSVIKACADNISENCHFLQADLHFPPFANHSFDVVYSSGVLHHTPNTKDAFRVVSDLVKTEGTYCVWLYKPYHNTLHKAVIGFRKITTRLPLRFQFWVYRIFLVPAHKVIAWARHRESKTWREIMIELFDSFTPQFRFEHEPDEVKSWFAECGLNEIEITTISPIGFSIKGSRGID